MMWRKKLDHQTKDKKCKFLPIFILPASAAWHLPHSWHTFHTFLFTSHIQGFRIQSKSKLQQSAISPYIAETGQYSLWQFCCRWPVIWMWRVRIRLGQKQNFPHIVRTQDSHTFVANCLATTWWGRRGYDNQDRKNNSGYGTVKNVGHLLFGP